MTYILVIMTVVGVFGQGHGNYIPSREYAWRPIGEFSSEGQQSQGSKTAKEMCEQAAKELEVKQYRCVRSK